jgi:hypothetical protein
MLSRAPPPTHEFGTDSNASGPIVYVFEAAYVECAVVNKQGHALKLKPKGYVMSIGLMEIGFALVAFAAALIGVNVGCSHPASAQTASPSEARTIAKEAYIYAFPMVEGYKTLYAQAVDKSGPNYRAPFNSIGNTALAFTPNDTAIVTPYSDTPYSFVWMDLRAEPIVLTLPEIDPKRFYHVQLIDL